MQRISSASTKLDESTVLRQDLMNKSRKIHFFSQDITGHSVIGMYINADGGQVFLSLGVDEARIISEILSAREMFTNGPTPAQALAE